MRKYVKPSDNVIRENLTEIQYRVTQDSATERPYYNQFWNTYEKGLYVDVVTGEPLFISDDKFESECGWPAFSKPIDDSYIVEKNDKSFGMIRTEVRSKIGDSHLGHVFRGEPGTPNGVRYCINSAALKFIPYNSIEDEGYGELLKFFK